MQIESAIRRRRALSLTSLIDVIFLLLLFFMLSSTFSKYTEVEVVSASKGQASNSEKPELFILLNGDEWVINGRAVPLTKLEQALGSHAGEKPVGAVLKISETVSSQQMMDAVSLLDQSNIKAVVVK